MDISDAKRRASSSPPYRAERVGALFPWVGVMDAQGRNCLSFHSKPGAVFTSLEHATAIAEAWNGQASAGSL